MRMHTGKRRSLPEGLGWRAKVTVQRGGGIFQVRLFPTAERRNSFGRPAFVWMAEVLKEGAWRYLFTAYRDESAQALVRRAIRIHNQEN